MNTICDSVPRCIVLKATNGATISKPQSNDSTNLSSWDVGSETALSVIIFNLVYNQNLCAWGDRLSDLLEICHVSRLPENSNYPAEDIQNMPNLLDTER
eukprot:15355608-Ditylum_brightwellii.AAC.1